MVQRVRFPGHLRVRDDVGHQSLVAGNVLANHGGHLAHDGQRAQGGFDFRQLDAVAAHLDLGIGAAEELQHAVVTPAREVSGAVEACPGHTGEGVRDEALGGE
ncbi:hypothetical protein OV427_17905 [Pyxidicoccus sp. MSG2]|nr:hypothetical protein [Pyxidicoccus sp. MSG2]MCY1017645.1 hypothetical protein [Pyxidicoccus sp. MSG2]